MVARLPVVERAPAPDRRIRMANEADTCRKYVVPKLQAAGWEDEPHRINEQGWESARLGVPLACITAEAKQVLPQLTEEAALEGPHWTEPVKFFILTAEARGTRIEFQGVGTQAKQPWRVPSKPRAGSKLKERC